MKIFVVIIILSISLLQSACSSLKPYESDSNLSFAGNVTKAAGVYKLDVSREDFIESYGKAVNGTEQAMSLIEGSLNAAEAGVNIASIISGTVNFAWVGNLFKNTTHAKDRQLMLAWLPKGDLESEEEAWEELNRIIAEATKQNNMPIKGQHNMPFGPYLYKDSKSRQSMFFKGCPTPFKCHLRSNNFDLPTEVTLPDFIGGGPGYFFEIERNDGNQTFRFECTSKALQFNYIGNVKDRNTFKSDYEECTNIMNKSAIEFSKNMPEWFFLYRPASFDY
ncbi:hypothetical protein, partial [Oleiphilus sp. HI0132]|uniref:hypothetical protein n=1 Tax=Oleiphilus sp. HI0132 TaxID=1822270 RepID=UPI0012E74C47